MSQGSKIVQLDSHRGNQNADKGVKLPAPLVKLRDRCGEHLRKLMVRLFDQMDDTYFDLADQAANNTEQSGYFDAMRELRLKKSRVTSLLIQGYTSDFQFNDAAAGADTKAPLDMENLSLVKDETLEEQVAIDNMINRFQGEAGRDLEHLTLRIDALLASVSVDDSNNPLGVAAITRNFAKACEDLDMDIRSKLVFFKLFEKHVLAHLKAMLEASNKYLIEQGVIPDMATVRPQRRQPAPAPTHAPAGNMAGHNGAYGHPATAGQTYDGQSYGGQNYGGQSYSGQTYNTQGGASDSYLSDSYNPDEFDNGLMIDPLALMSQNKPRNAGVGPAMNLPMLQQATLVSLLSAAQHNNMNVPTTSAGLVNYGNLLEHMVRNDSGKPRARVGDMHQDVMNLVNMLFEYILSDGQLQATVKALIARLQIPIVKVALLDNTFFNRGGHPARRLLNELATAAIGWTEKPKGENDPFVNKLEEVVLRLLNEFDSDIGIFDEILQDFQLFQESEKKRRQLVEQRTRDSEVGKAKSEAAKKEVQRELNARLEGQVVSDLVLEVLREGWSSYLVLLHLKYGTDHAEWHKALQTASTLVKATSLEGDVEALDLDAVAELIVELKEGLAQTAFKPFDLDKCLQTLEGQIVEVAQKRLETQVEFEDEFDYDAGEEDFESAILGGLQEEVETELDDIANDVNALEEIQAIASVTADIAVEVPEVLESADAVPVGDTPEQSSPAAVAAAPVTPAKIVLVADEEEEPAVAEAADEKTMQMVDRINIGTWVEVNEGEDKKYRCKLAAIIQTTGKYIFVNRMGVKVMEKSRLGLAMALKTHSMNLLDDGLLFDRALESVIGNLRENKSHQG